MMTAVVAMITESMKITIMSMKRMNVAAVMSTMSMSTMNAAVVMSMMSMGMMNATAAMSIMSMIIIMSMYPVILRTVSAKFAILMRNIAISVAKA